MNLSFKVNPHIISLARSVVLLLLLLTTFQTSFAQSEYKFYIGGIVKEGKDKLDGAKVNIIMDGSPVESFVTAKGGKFAFELDMEHEYIVEFGMRGYVTKRIKVSTMGVPEEEAEFGFEWPKVEIELFKEVQGLDVSILDNPIGRIYYDKKQSDFDYDAKYTKEIQHKLDELQEELEKRKEAEKNLEGNYKNAIAAGDRAMGLEKWEDAIKEYQEAVTLKPAESYPNDQIKKAQENINKAAELAAAKEQKQQQYDDLVAQGDNKFDADDLEGAKKSYQDALAVFAGESYPTNKIKEIDEMIAERKKKEEEAAAAEAAEKAKHDKYETILNQADSKFKANDFEGAKPLYQEASALYPNESYPKNKIKEVEDKLKELAEAKEAEAAKEEEYRQLIADADKLFEDEKFDEAKAQYTKGMELKPSDEYPKAQIQKIETKLKELADAEAANKAKEEQYNQLIADADNLFNESNWQEAKSKYQNALDIKSGEKYPTDRIAEIGKKLEELAKAEEEAKLAEEAEAKKRAQYDELVKQGDSQFGSESWEDAKSSYNQALALYSDEQYPKDKLAEIEEKIRSLKEQQEEQAAKEAGYKNLIESGDKMFKAEDWQGAKQAFNEALKVFPDEKYPTDKIKEIDGILAELESKEAAAQQREEEYNALIVKGDGQFDAENWEEAKTTYQDALALKENEKYPQEKLNEIEAKLEELAKAKEAEEAAAAEAAAKRKQFNELVSQADGKFNTKDYEGAKVLYQQANDLFPSESYPQEKLNEIDQILSDLAANQAEKQKKEEEYSQLISDADKAFTAEKLDDAKAKYQEALGIKPNEEYPKGRIKEIEDKLAELANAEAAAAAKEQKYNELIAKADELFNAEDWSSAKNSYNEALSIKSNEKYPKEKIADIDKRLEELAKNEAEAAKLAEAQAAKRKQYDAFITDADNKFNAEQYDDAKSLYNNALGVFPTESYPAEKISEIDKIIAELTANKNAEQEAKEAAYKELISDADGLFDAENWEESKDKYQQAIELKPGDKYPVKRISEIDGKLAELAKQRAKQEEANAKVAEKRKQYDDLIKKADDNLGDKDYQIAIGGYEAALGLFPNEQYPKDKIAEAQQKIKEKEAAVAAAEEEERKRREAEAQAAEEARIAADNAKKEAEVRQSYNAKIAEADGKFESGDYDAAEKAYAAAAEILPSETYPNDQIQKINTLRSEAKANKAKRAQYDDLISQADRNFGAKELEAAAKKYEEALELFHSEEYPQKQLQLIHDNLAAIAEQKAAAEEEERKAREAEEARLEEIRSKQFSLAQYRDVMERAELQFNFKHYDKALPLYKEAEAMRPDQDKPKERIAQINAMLSKEELKASGGGEQKLEFNNEFKDEYAKNYPQGVTEEKITEGNKTIITRIVVKGNHGAEYKCVIHGWGGKFYFKNGEAISERIWYQETE